MATKKKSYRSKKQKSKFKVFRDSLLLLSSAFFTKSRRLSGMLLNALKNGFGKFRSMPKILRILVIYALTVTLALSVFFWRVSQLRITEPPFSEPPFDWSVYLPDDQDSITGPLSSLGQNDTHPGESAGSEDPEPEPPKEIVAEEPVFLKGEWPVRGDLFYGFNEIVIQHGLGYSLHFTSKGVAIKAASGTQVVPSWDGTVKKVIDKDKPNGGQSVTIEHDNGMVSFYGALQKVTVSVGERVNQGQPFGQVAPGYQSEPDYLYLEILKDGRVVNPVDYLLF